MTAPGNWRHIGALALDAVKEAARKQRQLQPSLSETANNEDSPMAYSQDNAEGGASQ